MFRVRKVNRQALVPDARAFESRPRLQEFVFAAKRQARRKRGSPEPGGYREFHDLQARVGLADVPDTLLMRVMEGKTFVLMVPISRAGATPSMAEAMRVASALGLMRLLEAKGVGPLVVGLWPGVGEEFDQSPRLLIERDATLINSVEMDFGEIIAALPKTEFIPEIEAQFEAGEEPWLTKVRMLAHFAGSERVIALPSQPTEASKSTTLSRRSKSRSAYRHALSRVLERFPAIGLIHPSAGDTLSIDTGMRSAFDGEVVPFPTTMATIIEPKIERWLEKYDIAPEDLMAPKARVASLVADRFPKNAVATLQALRERVLGKIFRLEHQLQNEGFPSDKVLDKLANQVDTQFDRTKAQLESREAEERKIGHSQLSKARAYIRPQGELQYEAMALVHYLAYFGPEVLSDIVEAIQVGDTRHHLLYA